MKNILISNPRKLEKLKKSISKDGVKKLHILADFDRTMTRAFINGENTPSLISILRDGNYLTSSYVRKARNLYIKFHPIEINSKVLPEDKKKAMNEWWTTHFDLLIKSGLNKKDLEKVVESNKIKLRDGASEFIDFLYNNNIPLVIMSSSGLGGDIISMFLKKERKIHNNIHIVSNSYEWDKNGNAVSVKKPIIHVMNKNETVVKNLPFFNVIKNKKNIILLGDNLEDIRMVEGFAYDNLIKIGFLNESIKENLKQYKLKYDVVLLNDSSMD